MLEEEGFQDNSIKYAQYFTYKPYAGTTYKNSDYIKISIPTENIYNYKRKIVEPGWFSQCINKLY